VTDCWTGLLDSILGSRTHCTVHEPTMSDKSSIFVLEGKLAGSLFLGGEVGSDMTIDSWKTSLTYCFDEVLGKLPLHSSPLD
jgi:hypothetical protein